LLACPRREREESPAQAVVKRRRITIDESTLGKRLQRPRDLALFPPDELGDSYDP
jgi:hypothetical protein